MTLSNQKVRYTISIDKKALKNIQEAAKLNGRKVSNFFEYYGMVAAEAFIKNKRIGVVELSAENLIQEAANEENN